MNEMYKNLTGLELCNYAKYQHYLNDITDLPSQINRAVWGNVPDTLRKKGVDLEKEYELIQQKKSNLTKAERDYVVCVVERQRRNKRITEQSKGSVVRTNLLSRKGYSPYCGNPECHPMPRTIFNGEQFVCPHCGWVSDFPKDFIDTYKDKWGL